VKGHEGGMRLSNIITWTVVEIKTGSGWAHKNIVYWWKERTQFFWIFERSRTLLCCSIDSPVDLPLLSTPLPIDRQHRLFLLTILALNYTSLITLGE